MIAPARASIYAFAAFWHAPIESSSYALETVWVDHWKICKVADQASWLRCRSAWQASQGDQIEKLLGPDPLGRARQTIGRVAAAMNLLGRPHPATFANAVGALQDQAPFLGPDWPLTVTLVSRLPVIPFAGNLFILLAGPRSSVKFPLERAST